MVICVLNPYKTCLVRVMALDRSRCRQHYDSPSPPYICRSIGTDTNACGKATKQGSTDMAAKAALMTAESLSHSGRAPIPLAERLILALDIPSVEEAEHLIEELGSSIQFYKIGLQLQFAGGLTLASKLIASGRKVFLDSKIFDIDETVTNAVANVAKMGVTFLTVHGNGSTIRAAIEGRGRHELKIFSVTALTSLDAHDLADFGWNGT